MTVKDIAHLVGVCERNVVPGQNQRGAQNGLIELGQQIPADGIVRHPDADGLALGVHQAPGNLLGALVDEGIGPDDRFWRLAQALSALYPMGSAEKRWVDGVLSRKTGVGL